MNAWCKTYYCKGLYSTEELQTVGNQRRYFVSRRAVIRGLLRIGFTRDVSLL